jgi:hypothetical protein
MSRFQTASRRTLLLTALIALPCGVWASGAWAAEAATPDKAAAKDSGPTVTIQPLTKYSLADGTATVMLPDGWHVTQTGVAYIRAEGPKGEIAMFGVSVPAHDGMGGGVAPPAPLEQSYEADPGEKLNQSIQWVRAAGNLSPVHVIKIYSNDHFDAPPEFGNCTKLTATLGVGNGGTRGGVLDAEADLCSQPKDKAGNYTNFLKIVAISPALAKTERATLEAVLASYVVKIKALQKQTEALQKQTAQAAKQSTKMAAAQPMSGGMSGGGMSGGGMSGGAMSSRMAGNPMTAGGRQSLQQQIDAEIKAGGFTPQMVAAMRAQANANAMATMGPALRASQAATQAADYFDRTELRGEIPLSITNQGTFWLDPN